MTRSALLLPLLLAACVPAAPEGLAFVEGSAAEGAAFFGANCAACHGADGAGVGSGAEGLMPPPADLTRIAARNGGVFPPDFVMSTVNGFHRDAGSASAMPAWGNDVFGPTAVIELTPGIGTPVPLGLLAVSRYLEGVQR